ncbi:hypothetical protein ACTQ49_10035 [Luteococcus sp. Sow4_B9]|uniref:hypothetical protein n=1 Tax=Luteococcus sp. Sow4_B9 TaxID=3438792 RepID=UPI003F9A5F16
MTGAVFFIILLQWILPILLVGVIVLMVRRRRLTPDPTTHPDLARLERSSATARWVAILAAVGTVFIVAPQGRFGLGILLTPAACALTALVVLALNEALVWRRARTPGIAALETRSRTQYLPRQLLWATGLLTVALTALLVWCWLRQDPTPDAMGTVGRSFGWPRPASVDGDALEPLWEHSASGPYPGTWYSLPLAAVLGACVAVAALGVWLATTRPRNGADPAVVAVDDQTRRLSVEAMVAALQIGVGGSLAACATLAAFAIGDHLTEMAWLLVGAALFALAAATWALTMLLAPGRRFPAPRVSA